MDFANRWVWFFWVTRIAFSQILGFLSWVSLQRFSNLWLEAFPQTVFLSAGENRVLLFQSLTGKALWSVQHDSPLLWKENFSPDGSILVIWIFRALLEIPRQLICKRRDAQLPCIQRAIRDSRFWLSPSCLCHQATLDMAGGTLGLFGCPEMHSGPRLLCGGTCPEAGHAPNRVQRDDNGGVAEQPLPCTAKGCCYTSVAEVHGSFLCWRSEQWVYLAHQRIQGNVVLIMWGNCF